MHGQIRTVTLPEDKPYFLACGLFAPHLPWVVPQEFHDLFPREEMGISKELLEWVRTDLQDLSASGKRMTRNTGFTRLIERGLDMDGEGGDINAWKAAFQAYLATVAYSDRNVGLLLDAISRSPERDHTVVVLWSDHGYHIGDKNRTGKTTLWEAANHCNLIIHLPWADAKNGGVEIDHPVSLQEVYPTVVSLAGLSRPSHIHGYNLEPLLEEPSMTWNQPVLNTNGEGDHAIRTRDFRYLRYSNGDRELYDLRKDPFEYNNLAGDLTFAPLLDSLDNLLEIALEKGPGEYDPE
jgi:arylsulfatase A-like enzyme